MPISEKQIKENMTKAKPYLEEGIKLWRQRQQLRNEVAKVEREMEKWKGKLNKELSSDSLEFSSVMCTRFPGGHVYSEHFYKGTGHRACVFCGQDDFDF